MSTLSTQITANLPPEMHLVTPPVTAEILKVTEETLAVWRSTQRYPLRYVKVGRKVFYRMSDIQKFLNDRTMAGVSEVRPRGRGRAA
jgi:hypothetical protein